MHGHAQRVGVIGNGRDLVRSVNRTQLTGLRDGDREGLGAVLVAKTKSLLVNECRGQLALECRHGQQLEPTHGFRRR